MASSWFRRFFDRPASASSRNRTKGRTSRPLLPPERLEDRLAPAITILDSGVGTLDGLLGPTQGTITSAQSAGNQTLSRSALEGVGPAVNIDVASDAITFSTLTSPLTLQTGLGNSASFVTDGGALSFDTTTNVLAT